MAGEAVLPLPSFSRALTSCTLPPVASHSTLSSSTRRFWWHVLASSLKVNAGGGHCQRGPKKPSCLAPGWGLRAWHDGAEAALGGTEERGHQEVLGAPTRHPPLVSKVTGSENSPATALLHARTRKFMYFMSNFSPAGTVRSQTGHGEG